MLRLLTFFWFLAVVVLAGASCQNESKNQAATAEAEKPQPTLALPEDYSSELMGVSRKEYDPLAQRILVNHEAVKAKLPILQTGRVARSAAEDLIRRQHEIENGFTDAMKNFVYLEEKLASKEMTKAQYLQEKKNVLASLDRLDKISENLTQFLASGRVDSLAKGASEVGRSIK